MLGVAWYLNILATLFALVACFLMLVILLQRGRGVGLAGAFGGAGASTAFGAKTGDVLTWATIVIAGLFLLVAVGLNFVFVPARATAPVARTTPAGAPPGQQPPARTVPADGAPAEAPPASPQPAGGATPADSGAAPSAPPAQPAPTPAEPPPTPAQP